jgi:hypothetical protein
MIRELHEKLGELALDRGISWAALQSTACVAYA